MADDVQHPITGAGTADITQATDDAGGKHYVKIKLADGTADSTVMIPGTTNEGLKVNPHHNGTAATATWDSGTAQGTTLVVNTTGHNGVVVCIAGDGAGVSAGEIYVQLSFDGTNYTSDSVYLLDLNFFWEGLQYAITLSANGGERLAYWVPILYFAVERRLKK